MNLLDNPLVRKYFGRGSYEEYSPEGYPRSVEWISYAVLRAMQEPVKEGELYLAIGEYGKVTGPIAFTSSDNWKFHCQWLRLPDRFQPSFECPLHGLDRDESLCTCKPAPDPEAKGPCPGWSRSAPEKCDFSMGQDCLVHKPSSAVEKCKHGSQIPYCLPCSMGSTPQDKDAVEEKIRKIVDVLPDVRNLEYHLRALVKLAREGK